ncbi:MAG: uroporphyrinogen-III C-methyltransferase [Thermaerobacter sp.]|jgi:uroporphyrinogen III methyltransferase/synthase|nr:uroporphyrinogen-III C-methyltransferase [Thermaerobacter sp.]
MKGIVYLVGAGPGDPGLITCRGRECLEAAEVVVYDRLAGPELLRHARADAELIYVGKEANRHALPQEEINALLVERARAGQVVCRLKGGDPFVFGRGGEEAEQLARAGLPFEVVPGVTSAVAVPAYAGIPVTHRGYTASLAVATGHEDPSKGNSTVPWGPLAQGPGTLVFLMGIENLAGICRRLVREGRADTTPAAVIGAGTRPEQRTVTGTLADIASRAAAEQLAPPAVLVVGEVVRLRERLAWRERLPLFGRRILVTRSREQASDLSRRLADLGAAPWEFPTIRIVPPVDWEPVDAALERLSSFRWLVFTSRNGVEAFFRRLAEKGRDVRELAGVELVAIGPETARGLTARGLLPAFVPGEYRSEAVVQEMRGRASPGERALLARAAEGRDLLPRELAAMGLEVVQVAVYRTEQAARGAEEVRRALAAGELAAMTFTSSSTVRNFLEAVGREAVRDGTKVVCIGPVTAQTAREGGLAVHGVAATYTIRGLVDKTVEVLAGRRNPI